MLYPLWIGINYAMGCGASAASYNAIGHAKSVSLRCYFGVHDCILLLMFNFISDIFSGLCDAFACFSDTVCSILRCLLCFFRKFFCLLVGIVNLLLCLFFSIVDCFFSLIKKFVSFFCSVFNECHDRSCKDINVLYTNTIL